MNSKIVSLMLLVFLSNCILMLTLDVKAAYPPSTVYVLDAYYRAPVPKQYPILVLVDYVENLWRLNVTLTFNKNIAEALCLIDDGFLNEPYVATTTIDNIQGLVHLEATQQEPNKVV